MAKLLYVWSPTRGCDSKDKTKKFVEKMPHELDQRKHLRSSEEVQGKTSEGKFALKKFVHNFRFPCFPPEVIFRDLVRCFPLFVFHGKYFMSFAKRKFFFLAFNIQVGGFYLGNSSPHTHSHTYSSIPIYQSLSFAFARVTFCMCTKRSIF